MKDRKLSHRYNLIKVDDIKIDLDDSKSASRESYSFFDMDGEGSVFFSIVENSSNAVVVTDSNMNIIYVNKQFEIVSGYETCEVIGRNPRILKSNKTPMSTYKDLMNKLKLEGFWNGIFINKHRNGNEYIEEAYISSIYNKDGEIEYYFAEKRDITLQKSAEDSVTKLTYYDHLTQLPNRVFFISELEKITKNDDRNRNCFSLIFADIDSFKEINDGLGHQVGDMILKNVGKRFSNILQPGDFLARIGADEFAIIHKEATSTSTNKLCKRMEEVLVPSIVPQKSDIGLRVSIGSCLWPQDGKSVKELLSNTDVAKNNSKSTGRGFVQYSDTIGSSFYRQIEISNRIGKALSNNSFYLVYQPKIELRAGKISGFEALLRWRDPDLGLISPVEFIPIAERYKKMNEVGEWVFREACKHLKQWKAAGLSIPGRLALNVSVQQLEQPEFVEHIIETLKEEELSPTEFEFEVTESVLMSDPVKIMYDINLLSSMGLFFSVDDFGTGFSSLSYLKNLNAATLKIDKSFIENISSNISDRAIVKSVIDLANNLKMTVVAEGIETKEQLEFVRSIGCEMGQGYYFSLPVEAELVPSLLHTE